MGSLEKSEKQFQVLYINTYTDSLETVLLINQVENSYTCYDNTLHKADNSSITISTLHVIEILSKSKQPSAIALYASMEIRLYCNPKTR